MLKNFLKFSLGAVTMIAFGAALYFAASYYKEWKDKNNVAQQQKPDEIIITELPNGEKLVENKTEGVSVKVASGWTIDGTMEQFYSPETEKQTNPGSIEVGCKIATNVSLSNLSIQDLEKKLKMEHLELYTVEKDDFIPFTIINHESLKNILKTSEFGKSTSVYILTGGKLYSLSIMSSAQDEEKCSQEFDKFLQTVSIK